MYAPRLFSLPFAPLSVIPLIAVTVLISACQLQNLVINAAPTSTKPASTEKTAKTDASTPDLITPESQANAQDVTNSAPATTSTIAPKITLKITPEIAPEIAPEIVISAPPPPPPPPAEFKPHTVLSKPDTVLLSMLGAADIIRTEGMVKIWQYRLDRCVFDFFLTPDNSLNADGRYAVRGWAYRATTLGATANELICRRALAKDRMTPHE